MKYYDMINRTIDYDKDNNLNNLANKYETDKGNGDPSDLSWGAFAKQHGLKCWGYTDIYEKYMSPYRESHIRFLEIGICDWRFPLASIKMWLSYFRDIELYCIDLLIAQSLDSGGTTDEIIKLGANFFYMDQGNEEDWNGVVKQIGKNSLDFVVEDGSHIPEHMTYALYRCSNLLKSGGYFFMEDIHNPELTHYQPKWGYNTAKLFDELNQFYKTGEFKSIYLSDKRCKIIEDNYTFIELVLDKSNSNYIAVFKKK